MLFATLAAAVLGYLIAYPPTLPSLSPALHHPSTPRGTLLTLYPPPPLQMTRIVLTGTHSPRPHPLPVSQLWASM